MRKILTVLLGAFFFLALLVTVVKLTDRNSVGPQLEASLQTSVPPVPEATPTVTVFPSNSVYQGEAFRVEIENFGEPPVAAVFRGQEHKFFDYRGKLTAVIPLAVDAPTGEVVLAVGSETSTIAIRPGIFQVEEIGPFKPLTPAQLARRQEETKSIATAYKTVAPTVYFDSAFIPPLEKLFETAPFGVQRIQRGTKEKLQPHNGVDLRAEVGTPVKAANDGIVELAESYLLEGGFVILDHGLGINSVYLHLSKVLVDSGQIVKKGDIIGLSGGSGQSAGPHLHFMIKINSIAVDPLRFLLLWQ